jgi:hypothetical protein
MSEMTWSETRRRQDVVTEVRAMADLCRDGVLPWSDDYADAFATPKDLLTELEYRWRVHVETQIDTNLPEPELEDRWSSLHDRWGGVIHILEAARTRELVAA